MFTSKHLYDGHEYAVYNLSHASHPGCWQIYSIAGELVAVVQQDETGEYLHITVPDSPELDFSVYHSASIAHEDVFDIVKGVL